MHARGRGYVPVVSNVRPHPAYAQAFLAYSNYLNAIAGDLGRRYGHGTALAEGVRDAVLAHPQLHGVQRRPLTDDVQATFDAGMRKGWAFLRRVLQEVADDALYDEEANALLPYSAWYAVHHIGRAFCVASRQEIPTTHQALLHQLGRSVVKRGLLPLPWAAWSEGCPQLDTTVYGGIGPVGDIHVLSHPTPDTTEDRLALVLRTTRKRDVERVFDEARGRQVTRGRTRRNLGSEEKKRLASRLAPTTLFDFMYRLRIAASYGDADVFVLGSEDEVDARRLAVSLGVLCDATVAGLEALVAAYAGPAVVAKAARSYSERAGSELIQRRAADWDGRAPARRASAPPASVLDDDIPF